MRAHRRLEPVGLGPGPVVVPGAQVVRPVGVLQIEPGRQRRQLARVAACTALGEHDLAAIDGLARLGQIGRAIRRVLQIVRIGAGEEEARHVRRLLLGRAPVDRVFLDGLERNRRDRLAAEQRAEVQQPLFAEQPDVDVDAVQGAERAHRIRTILEHPRRPRRARRREELRERIARRHELVELLVVQAAAAQRFLAPLLRQAHARPEVVDRVHRARVVDVVGRDERGIERAGPRHVQRLIEDAGFVLQPLPVEDADPTRSTGPRRSS